MSPWMTSPDTTVMAYSPSFCPITDGSPISRIFPAMRNTMPKGKYLQRISIKKLFMRAQQSLKHYMTVITVFGTMWYSHMKINPMLTIDICRRIIIR